MHTATITIATAALPVLADPSQFKIHATWPDGSTQDLFVPIDQTEVTLPPLGPGTCSLAVTAVTSDGTGAASPDGTAYPPATLTFTVPATLSGPIPQTITVSLS